MILICGGAGYIGSHMSAYLREQGREVVIIDNLMSGHKQAIGDTKLYVGDIRDSAFLDTVFNENSITAVINFAALSLVEESMQYPLKYFDNNVGGIISLLSAMVKHNVKNIVFSSTATVYGLSKQMPLHENADLQPENPYGESKCMVEDILKWCDVCHGVKYAVLRYFNVAGTHPNGHIGENHNPETHLIPIIAQVALGQREKIIIYGNDYPTADGTCIRDYIHIMDLAEAHDLALESLHKHGKSSTYNIGSGVGYSVKEVVDAFEKIIGRAIPKEIGYRRSGDTAKLVADYDAIKKDLGWQPKHSLSDMISSAWNWHGKHPQGFK